MKASVLAVALLCASPLIATQAPAGEPNAASRMDNLATLLDLTDAQKAQVQTVLQEEHAKMKASFEEAKASGTKPDWQQMKALHQQIQQETLQKLAPVLSATQMKKFQIIQQAMHGHGHFNHGGPPSAAAPAAPAGQN
jgi:ribulose bisphosphate carboxylase small subunit